MSEASPAGRFAGFRLTPEQRGAAWLILGLCVACAAAYPFLQQLLPTLAYDRTAVMEGEIWRVVSPVLLHGSFTHLFWNLVSLLLAYVILFDAASARDWTIIMLVSSTVTSVGLLILNPAVQNYIGMSATSHGLFAGGAVLLMARGRPIYGAAVLAFLAGMVAWEVTVGPIEMPGTVGQGVLTEAHLYGFVGGLAAGLVLAAVRRAGHRPG